ncbi:MAG TPA: NHL repeat-containing protein [Kofleriaceae bacterium]
MRKTMRSPWFVPCLIVLAAASCGFPRLAELADAGNGSEAVFGLELLAGDIGGLGNEDGTGAAARFNNPAGVAVDSSGNVYIADLGNHTIRKVTAAGVVTTLAGTAGMAGSMDGTAAAARFFNPFGVAVDSFGNVYVADGGNHIIRKVTAAGGVTTLAGTVGMNGSVDDTGAAARFYTPFGVAVDSSGNVYVADLGNGSIRKVTAAGVVTTLAGTAGMDGSVDGTGAAARFSLPSGVAVDTAGNVYVADFGNHTIRKITAVGVVTTLAGTAGMVGSVDGTGTAARFSHPSSVAVDSAGNVYVADNDNHTIRKVTPAGGVTTLAGTAGIVGSADGAGDAARFFRPAGVAVDRAGNVYIADSDGDTIRKVTAAGIVTTTLAGAASAFGSADSTGDAARFFSPAGVAFDSSGNVYVADFGNQTIRKITAAGVVTTLAGTAGMRGSTDGIGAAALFFDPVGVAVDRAGNVYVADNGNHTIRKITAAGVVTTLAGTAGMDGSVDGTGAAARFFRPSDVAVDSSGNVYVADNGNHTIRKVTPAGVVMTLAGSAGTSGSSDGTGAAARFFNPASVAIDSTGNVYVTDYSNSTIRKVTPAGTTTTIAGVAGVVGIVLGTIPRFASPISLAIAGDSIIVSDTNAILLLRHGAQ